MKLKGLEKHAQWAGLALAYYYGFISKYNYNYLYSGSLEKLRRSRSRFLAMLISNPRSVNRRVLIIIRYSYYILHTSLRKLSQAYPLSRFDS